MTPDLESEDLLDDDAEAVLLNPNVAQDSSSRNLLKVQSASTNDIREDSRIFGRTEETYTALKKIQENRHVLIRGEKGIGKTVIIHNIIDILNGDARLDYSSATEAHRKKFENARIRPAQFKIIYIPQSSPIGTALDALLISLYNNNDLAVDNVHEYFPESSNPLHSYKFSEIRSRCLRNRTEKENAVISSLRGKNYLLCFDSIEHVGQSHVSLLNSLMSICTLFCATSTMAVSPGLTKFYSSFTILDLQPLPKPVVAFLVDYYLVKYRIRCVDDQALITHIVNASHGNPFAVKNHLWQITSSGHVLLDDIRGIQSKTSSMYLNAGPVYSFGLAILLFIKFMYSHIFYEKFLYATLILILAIMVFKVFRIFFIFRPRMRPDR